MKRKVLIIATIILVTVSIFIAYSYSFDTYHFRGEGKYFGSGVNATPGKSVDLVIHSKSKMKIENIEYNLKGNFGLKSSGRISLGEDGYYIGLITRETSKLNINKIDIITLELNWNGETEIIKMKNTD